ncbi:MAG: sugar transferase [Thermoanaerobacteraceae bacterium]|nr:sugar transferase [Thermoanaerobacteraceae bacterium]
MRKSQYTQYRIKVLLDKIFALALLILLLPLFIIISILIKLDSEGPIIFKQKRLGKNGKTFTIYKFRTMCNNAEKKGAGIFVSKNDPRITRVGRFLRKTSLDELPQLVNILKSEMSFVGPRPPLESHPYQYKDYNDIQRLRFEILPGITGYAQAYGRNCIEWPKRIEMDVFYYKNYSLIFDLKIIISTIFNVIFSKGVYSHRHEMKNSGSVLKRG